jgi:hypothetical protein
MLGRDMHRLGIFLLLTMLLLLELQPAASARADTTAVYKCTSVQGQVIYQAAPCAQGQQQQTMQLQNNGPASSPLPEAVDTTPPSPAKTPPPAPSEPRTAPAPMYRCINAVNGNNYFSSNGNPQPYYAPLAVTGMIPVPLGQSYAPAGHGAATSATIASNYVLVQDTCRAMTPEDTCSELRTQYDENERKLSRAFKSDEAPLLQRESELLAQLKHC